MKLSNWLGGLLLASVVACGNSSSPPGGPGKGPALPPVDPGTARWEKVPPDQVSSECGLDPELLEAADAALASPYAIIRYGKLCHEYYPDGEDPMSEVFSATKTLGGVVTGVASWETRNLERNGRKTGPLTVDDRVDHWLDEFTFNTDAKVGHVLGMVAFNEDLSFPNRVFAYDGDGTREINRLSDILNTLIAQDPQRLGTDLDEFTRRFLFEPLGMQNSLWSNGTPNKIFGFTWSSTVRDMARLGLLLLNDGMWNGQRVLASDWVYEQLHPNFEDANANYGYLTWISSRSFRPTFGSCAPPALWNQYPHGQLSEAPDCDYPENLSCEQDFDVGAWSAMGLLGQYIHGHPGLDLLLVGKNMGDAVLPRGFWDAVRPALVALDPVYAGDEEAFCAAYGAGRYAPDRRP